MSFDRHATIFCFFILMGSHLCNSQSFEASLSNSITNKEWCGYEHMNKNLIQIIEPALGYSYNKNSFRLGVAFPIIVENKNETIETALGVSLGYKYFFTSTKNEVFDIYPIYKFSCFRLKYNSRPSGFDSNWHVNHFFNQLGVGVKYRIANRLFINSDLLFGITSFKNIPINVIDGDPLFSKMNNYRHERIVYFGVGISYNLKKK